MHRRSLGRAAALATAALMALTGVVAAESWLGDGDIAEPEAQGAHYLGVFPPSVEIEVPFGFVLNCTGVNHVDAGQTATVAFDSALVSGPGGEVVASTPATAGPIGASWPADGEGCPSPTPSLTATNGTLTLRTPSIGGTGFSYDVMFTRSVTPDGNGDGSALGLRAPAITLTLDVDANTPPVFTFDPIETVEADAPGGWIADWATVVEIEDAEDDPEPPFVCANVAEGGLVPLGTVPILCSALDSGGLIGYASFQLVVEDTTDPQLAAVDDRQVTTGDPAGAVVSFDAPVATDIADPDVDVACLPVSGIVFPVGTTPVTCVATDDSGNEAATSFDVIVDYVPVHVAGAAWLEPVGVADGGTFVANRGRNLPIKVVLSVDGAPRTSGAAALSVAPCGGGPATTVPLTYGGGRWNANLDTGPLGGWCHTLTASIDGLTAGSFQLDLRGGEPAKAKATKG